MEHCVCYTYMCNLYLTLSRSELMESKFSSSWKCKTMSLWGGQNGIIICSSKCLMEKTGGEYRVNSCCPHLLRVWLSSSGTLLLVEGRSNPKGFSGRFVFCFCKSLPMFSVCSGVRPLSGLGPFTLGERRLVFFRGLPS